MRMDTTPTPKTLLTRSNLKTLKGEKQGYATAIMHLAPARLAGVGEVCPFRSAGCTATCLNVSGHGYYQNTQDTRINKTRFWKNDREAFDALLARDIESHIRYANRNGLKPAIRLNGTSDIPWEKFEFQGSENVFAAYPDVQFYDYTKWPIDRRGDIPANYHLTFSLAENNHETAADALDRGLKVAAVFRVKRDESLPARYRFMGKNRNVIDGDVADTRFMDAGGTIVGLRAKGRARQDTSGFVLDV